VRVLIIGFVLLVIIIISKSMVNFGVDRGVMNKFLNPPFSYFGGKRRVADIIWKAIGDVDVYIEPFFGGGAVLFARPNYIPSRHKEIVCDKDGFVANFWRALKYSPNEVAKYVDYPCNHIDLIAIKRYLLDNKDSLYEKLTNDIEFYDAKLAGYWAWVFVYSIFPLVRDTNTRPNIMGGTGLCSYPLIEMYDASRDVDDVSLLDKPYNLTIYRWLRVLSERLRFVIIVCNDFSEVLEGHPSVFDGNSIGIFFDPPYGINDRKDDIYMVDDKDAPKRVKDFCIEFGNNPLYHIVIAGYEEYEGLLNYGWRVFKWKANGGFSGLSGSSLTRGKVNASRETLYFSPHCRDISLWLESVSRFNRKMKDKNIVK